MSHVGGILDPPCEKLKEGAKFLLWGSHGAKDPKKQKIPEKIWHSKGSPCGFSWRIKNSADIHTELSQ